MVQNTTIEETKQSQTKTQTITEGSDPRLATVGWYGVVRRERKRVKKDTTPLRVNEPVRILRAAQTHRMETEHGPDRRGHRPTCIIQSLLYTN